MRVPGIRSDRRRDNGAMFDSLDETSWNKMKARNFSELQNG